MRRLFSIILVFVCLLLIPFAANAKDKPMDEFQPTPASYIWYDARTYADDSLSRRVGGWHFVVEWAGDLPTFDDAQAIVDKIKKIEFVNNTTGLELVFLPETLQRYIWRGSHSVGAYLWLGHEWIAQGEWTATVFAKGGNYSKDFSLTKDEILVPKPPFIQIIDTEAVTGGTLITYKAPLTDWEGPIRVMLRIMTDGNDDGFRDECIDQINLAGPSDQLQTVVVPYSGSEVEGRMEYRYTIGTVIGVSRTVMYFDFP